MGTPLGTESQRLTESIPEDEDEFNDEERSFQRKLSDFVDPRVLEEE